MPKRAKKTKQGKNARHKSPRPSPQLSEPSSPDEDAVSPVANPDEEQTSCPLPAAAVATAAGKAVHFSKSCDAPPAASDELPPPMQGPGSNGNALPSLLRSPSFMNVWPERPPQRQYEVLSCPSMESMALRMQLAQPERFRFHPSSWMKFDGGLTDHIELGGYTPVNHVRHRHVLFLADFANNDVTLSQFHAFVVILQSFVESLTVVLPFYPVGTMERCTTEGVIATANSLAQLFCGLPDCGKPIRLVLYDLHTLQNRFFWNQRTIADLQSAIPLAKQAMPKFGINCVAFPDDGAAKRFGDKFATYGEAVVCAKKRDGDSRVVTVNHGNPRGKHCLIVDDLVRSGGTLRECSEALRKMGALSVTAFVTHAVFPDQVWRRFAKGGVWEGSFDRFWVSNSCPSVTDEMPTDDIFTVMDLSPLIIEML